MKKLVLIFAALCLSSMVAKPVVKRGQWNPRVRPGMSLAQALHIAQEELKSPTISKEKANGLYCLSAELIGEDAKDSGWRFKFASEEGEVWIVDVAFDSKVFLHPLGDHARDVKAPPNKPLKPTATGFGFYRSGAQAAA